jgi:opacity protein-like surface antigen
MQSVIKKLILLAAFTALALIFSTSLALADTMTVSFGASGHHVYYKLGKDKKDTSTVEFELLVNDMEKTGYCVDLKQSIGQNTYDVSALFNDDAYNRDRLAFLEAAWIMKEFAPGLGNDPEHGYSVTDVVTAVQIAIWEVTYDQSSHDLYRGYFELQKNKPNNANAVYLANQYIQAVDRVSDTLHYSMFNGFGVAVSGSKQDLLFGSLPGTPPPPGGETPEPASMLLFGSALGVGGWYRRRQLKKKKA